jgi:tRNA U34 5-carboxymethylaminomethyl modifying GTPase MnmE/TrmE
MTQRPEKKPEIVWISNESDLSSEEEAVQKPETNELTTPQVTQHQQDRFEIFNKNIQEGYENTIKKIAFMTNENKKYVTKGATVLPEHWEVPETQGMERVRTPTPVNSQQEASPIATEISPTEIDWNWSQIHEELKDNQPEPEVEKSCEKTVEHVSQDLGELNGDSQEDDVLDQEIVKRHNQKVLEEAANVQKPTTSNNPVITEKQQKSNPDGVKRTATQYSSPLLEDQPTKKTQVS